jgi:predicted aminopeptidase
MRKMMYVLALLLVLDFLAGCAAKYTDVRATMNGVIKDTAEFTAALDKISDAKEAAPLVDAYLAKTKAYKEKMDAFIKLYPELGGPMPPAELQDVTVDKRKAVSEKNEVINKKLEVWTDPDLRGKLDHLR